MLCNCCCYSAELKPIHLHKHNTSIWREMTYRKCKAISLWGPVGGVRGDNRVHFMPPVRESLVTTDLRLGPKRGRGEPGLYPRRPCLPPFFFTYPIALVSPIRGPDSNWADMAVSALKMLHHPPPKSPFSFLKLTLNIFKPIMLVSLNVLNSIINNL